MALLLAGAGALGCARTPATRPSTPTPVSVSPPAAPKGAALDDMLRSDLAADHAFPWSAEKRLTWSDFQASPPATGVEGARTAYTLYYAWSCRGEEFAFRVIAGFRPRESWVKPAVLTDTAQRRSVLGHEQTHFDLVEVHARRMRRDFAQLAAPCGKSDAELTARARRFVQEEKAEQRRYDDETSHGLLLDKQVAWTAEVSRQLGR